MVEGHLEGRAGVREGEGESWGGGWVGSEQLGVPTRALMVSWNPSGVPQKISARAVCPSVIIRSAHKLYVVP